VDHDEEKPQPKSYQAGACGARPGPRLLKRYTVARFLTFAGYAGVGLEGVCHVIPLLARGPGRFAHSVRGLFARLGVRRGGDGKLGACRQAALIP